MADIIHLTDKPVRNTTAIIQELRLALPVHMYDEADLLLTMYEGTSITIELWTGMQTETEEGWVLAGTFTVLSAQGEAKLNIKNFLGFLRWKQTTASAATFLINGIGRRWA
jgi:hypothetical protein